MSWMEELAYDNAEPPTPIDVEITKAQFKSAAHACNPKVSCNGTPYAVWKVCGQHERISKIHSRMLSMPFCNGISPTRWRRCLEVMLKKDP